MEHPQVDPLVRLPDLIGQREITPEQAIHNRKTGKRGKRARPGKSGIVPLSSPTLYRKIKAGQFPAPIRIGDNCVAWRLSEVKRWLESQVAARSAPAFPNR